VVAERVFALGQELVRVHDGLREELARVRDAARAGDHPVVGASLLAHCTAFCSALTEHHGGEDEHVFPVLARRFPDLASVIENLAEDHVLIAGIVARVQEVMAGLGAGGDTDRLLGELDGLAAILESHISFEERRTARALDALTDRWTSSTERLTTVGNRA
jgi:iron-sulfur cluster repair protein YtfE (RIC family)